MLEYQPDYGTGQKKLSIYVYGLVACILLTILSFWAVMANPFSKHAILAIIFASAIVQFLVQVICFLRLNTSTEQGLNNVLSIVFTFVILVTIIAGSLWIMWNVNYYMMH
jgi:cytochrome o ubiquinol oxidase operon protein cyoD